MDKIIIRKIEGGWQVARSKTAGLNKGETVLATLCGGNMGKVLAATVAKQAATMTMVDTIEFEERQRTYADRAAEQREAGFVPGVGKITKKEA